MRPQSPNLPTGTVPEKAPCIDRRYRVQTQIHNMYMYVYVCVFICTYTYIHACVKATTNTTHTHYMHIHIHIYIYIYLYLFIYIHIHGYVCMYVYIYIYTHVILYTCPAHSFQSKALHLGAVSAQLRGDEAFCSFGQFRNLRLATLRDRGQSVLEKTDFNVASCASVSQYQPRRCTLQPRRRELLCRKLLQSCQLRLQAPDLGILPRPGGAPPQFFLGLRTTLDIFSDQGLYLRGGC